MNSALWSGQAQFANVNRNKSQFIPNGSVNEAPWMMDTIDRKTMQFLKQSKL